MGKKKRDDYLRKHRLSAIDFLSERPFALDCGAKAVPRRGTRDFAMLFITREQDIISNLTMHENETFVDLGANVGSYTLMIANNYKSKGVKVIAIEPHPGNYEALCRNIDLNKLRNVKTINKAASDHKGLVNLYERSHDGSRVDSDLYSFSNISVMDHYNIIHPEGGALQLQCDTLDNMLFDQRPDVIKMDVEGAEFLALKGAAKILSKVRKIIVEVHGDNVHHVERLLRGHDFDTQFIDKGMTHIMGSKTPSL